MSQHVPAWQRIVIRQQHDQSNDNDFDGEDPLNVTTHLATGSLTKKEKKRIIRGGDSESTKKKVTKKVDTHKRREKLKKAEREEKRRKTVLKDQLRYLIEFHLYRVSDELPQDLYRLPNVESNYSEEVLSERKSDNAAVEIWKFSKQKQNWLIKHFFNVNELPVEYDNLLMSYFADLKSETLRSILVDKSWAMVKEWNEFCEKQEQEIKRIVEGSEEKEKEVEGRETTDNDNKKEQLEESKSDLVASPNKDMVSRSVKLLKLWKLDEGDGKSIELKNF